MNKHLKSESVFHLNMYNPGCASSIFSILIVFIKVLTALIENRLCSLLLSCVCERMRLKILVNTTLMLSQVMMHLPQIQHSNSLPFNLHYQIFINKTYLLVSYMINHHFITCLCIILLKFTPFPSFTLFTPRQFSAVISHHSQYKFIKTS